MVACTRLLLHNSAAARCNASLTSGRVTWFPDLIALQMLNNTFSMPLLNSGEDSEAAIES